MPSPPLLSAAFDDINDDKPRRRWYHNLPLYGVILLLLAPQPSILLILVHQYLLVLNSPARFAFHLLAIYSITFVTFSSLIVLVIRDPGPVSLEDPQTSDPNDEQVGLTEALMSSDDFSAPGKWCRICWAPKPDRTHHCSFCGRCVLKMDHHCPWLGNRCIGHRTYSAFLHFLLGIVLLASYVAILCAHALYYAFNNPYSVDDTAPVHEILLTFAGMAFTLVIGSFFSYHLYLVSTNQTTLENITPFLLLRYLPTLPHTGSNSGPSDPPMEHELSFKQRRLVKDAHSHIRIFDVGFKKNWSQVFGWKRPSGLLYRALCGGGGMGDGKSFPRNLNADQLLARLARELVAEGKNT